MTLGTSFAEINLSVHRPTGRQLANCAAVLPRVVLASDNSSDIAILRSSQFVLYLATCAHRSDPESGSGESTGNSEHSDCRGI